MRRRDAPPKSGSSMGLIEEHHVVVGHFKPTTGGRP